jgi:high-affinity Fe2+/Pb2+ permease
MPNRSRKAKRRTADAARVAASRRGVGQLARLGYFAIGVVYSAMGVLAMLGVLGVGAGQYTGSFGAIRALRSQPYGRVILGIIAAGVAVYVTWRLAQSVFDVEDRGTSTGGLLRRGGLLLSAFAYIVLIARIVVQMFVGLSSEASAQASDWSKPLMNHPAGLALIGLAGVAMLAVAGVQFWTAYRAGFLEQIAASSGSKRSVSALGRFGFFSRGVVFGIMAFFLIISAIRTSPSSAKGLGGAIQTLGQQPYGRFLIGVVAIGLFSYGLFMLSKARFRHLAPGTPGEDEGESDSEEGDSERRRTEEERTT